MAGCVGAPTNVGGVETCADVGLHARPSKTQHVSVPPFAKRPRSKLASLEEKEKQKASVGYGGSGGNGGTGCAEAPAARHGSSLLPSEHGDSGRNRSDVDEGKAGTDAETEARRKETLQQSGFL